MKSLTQCNKSRIDVHLQKVCLEWLSISKRLCFQLLDYKSNSWILTVPWNKHSTYVICLTGTHQPDGQLVLHMNYHTENPCSTDARANLQVSLMAELHLMNAASPMCSDPNCDSLSVTVQCIDSSHGALYAAQGTFVVPRCEIMYWF